MTWRNLHHMTTFLTLTMPMLDVEPLGLYSNNYSTTTISLKRDLADDGKKEKKFHRPTR